MVKKKKKKKNPPANAEMQVPSMGQEDPLEEEIPTHSSILAWRIPWTEETGRLQSMWSQRVGHDLATKRQQWELHRLESHEVK